MSPLERLPHQRCASIQFALQECVEAVRWIALISNLRTRIEPDFASQFYDALQLLVAQTGE
jgi:hypothetical protein